MGCVKKVSGGGNSTIPEDLLEKIAPYIGGDSDKSQKLLNLLGKIQSYIGGDFGRIQELLDLLGKIQSYIVGDLKNVQELLDCLSLSPLSLQFRQEIRKLIVDVFVDEPLEPDFGIDGCRRAIVEEMRNNGYIKLIKEKEYGYKGTKIIIRLPRIKDKGFEGFACKYFVPEVDFSQKMLKQELQLHPEYEEKLESPKGVSELLESFKQYMKVREVEVDKEIDDYYEYFDGKNRKHKTCEVGEMLRGVWIDEPSLIGKQFWLQGNIVFDYSKNMCRFIYSCFSDELRKILFRLS